MKMVITGGAGFIGSNLVDKLIEDGHHVIILDNLSTGKLENINPKSNFVKIDLVSADQTFLNAIIDGADYVFHLAAKARVQPSILEPILFNEHNVIATLKTLEACRANKNLKRLIFSSSSSVYGQNDIVPFNETMDLNPMSPYALQKQIGEQYCKLYSKIYNVDTVCLRYFSVYGNRQPTEGAYCTVLGIFTRQTKSGEALTITNDGAQKRDFTNVIDVVSANIKAMEFSKPLNGSCFNIGFGKSVSINEIASYFGNEIKYIGEVLEPKETLADYSKAKMILDWRPRFAITEKYVKGLING